MERNDANHPNPTLHEIANEIASIISRVKAGPLRLWGNWTGRPFENGYKLVACEAIGDCLRLHFSEGEVLSVWDPIGVSINETQFWIANAKAMRWTHYYYGCPRTIENLYYTDYAREDGGIVYRTNVETTRGMGWLDADSSFAAVDMPSPHSPEFP